MSTQASILVAGKSYPVSAGAKIPSGEWIVSAVTDGKPAKVLQVTPVGSKVPQYESKDGTLRFQQNPGKHLIGWIGERRGSYTGIIVECIKAPRKAILGVCIGHQIAERTAVDEEGLRLTPFASMVSSDWLNPTNFSLNFTTEIEAAQWHRKHMRPGTHLNVRGPNLWSSRRWADLTIEDWQAWANAAVDSGFAALVDSFAGPNEPNGPGYSGDPDRNTPAGRARINAGWNAAAAILRKRTGKLVATPSYQGRDTLEYAIEAIRQCTNCNAVDIHPYGWTRQHFTTLRQAAGDRVIFATEFGVQPRYKNPDGTDDIQGQANANRRELPMIRDGVDFGAQFEWRNPRKVDDAANRHMGAHTIDGQRRGPMYDQMVRMMRPIAVYDNIWGVFRNSGPIPYTPLAADANRLIGVPPARPDLVPQITKWIEPGGLAYVDHLTVGKFDKPAEHAAAYMPAIDALRANGNRVILYATTRGYAYTANPSGAEQWRRELREFWPLIKDKVSGCGLRGYVDKGYGAIALKRDIDEARAIIGSSVPVFVFVSPYYSGHQPNGLVPLDLYRTQVRTAIDAGATDIIVWAATNNPDECRIYLTIALEEAAK